ncbi:MAG TPA: hypothetical protein VGY31_13435 [Terriglobia bacterium]|nr:hypothetical protein [Terriglobia bacterium]
MGLTESKIKDLKDKKFDKLYDKYEGHWNTMVGNAFDFTKQHLTGGRDPRPDDILKVLLPTLEIDESLRNHQEDNKARFKHFREFFGDYIIDKFVQDKGAKRK